MNSFVKNILTNLLWVLRNGVRLWAIGCIVFLLIGPSIVLSEDASEDEKVVEILKEPTLLLVNSSRNELLVTLATLHHIPEYREKLEPRVAARASRLAAGVSTSREIARLLRHLTGDEQEALYARYLEMAAQEARTGGLSEIRAFLDAPDFSNHAAREEIEDRLVTVCGQTYRSPDGGDETLTFFASLLVEMCKRDTSQLQYRIVRTDVDNVADAAPQLAKVAEEFATVLGSPLPVRAVKGSRDAMLELSVQGFASLGVLSYPCTLEIERLFESDGPKQITVSSTCVRVIDDWDAYR